MASLAAITEQEIDLISRLSSLLEQEQEALQRGEAVVLPEIGAKKLELIDQLNALELQRVQILGIDGNASAGAAMERWLAHHPNEHRTAGNWQKLMAMARKAKHLHELNAGLVNMHLQQTNEMLAVLVQRAEKNVLYGSNGQTATATGSRIIDSA